MKELIIEKKGPCLESSTFLILNNTLHALTSQNSLFRIERTLNLGKEPSIIQEEYFVHKFDFGTSRVGTIISFGTLFIVAFNQDTEFGYLKVFELQSCNKEGILIWSVVDSGVQVNLTGVKYGIQHSVDKLMLWIDSGVKNEIHLKSLNIQKLMENEVRLTDVEVKKNQMSLQHVKKNKYLNKNSCEEYLDMNLVKKNREKVEIKSFDQKSNFMIQGIRSGLLSLKFTCNGINFTSGDSLHVIFPYQGVNSCTEPNFHNLALNRKNEDFNKELIIKQSYFKKMCVTGTLLKQKIKISKVQKQEFDLDLDDESDLKSALFFEEINPN